MMKLSKAQKGVVAGMAAGFIVSILILSCVAAFVHLAGYVHGQIPGRLQLLGASALLPALALAFAIARLASHRFWTPQDLDGSGLTHGTDQAKLLQAVLQNTLEQVALALPVYAAWLLLAPANLLAVVPTAAVLFVIGRALFFWGYARGAPGRALGFSLTFYPSVLVLAGSVVLMFMWIFP